MDIREQYEKEFSGLPIDEFISKLDSMEDDDLKAQYAICICNDILELEIHNFVMYNYELADKDEYIKLLIDVEPYLPEEDFWTDNNWKFTVLSYIIQGQYDDVEKYLKNVIFPSYSEDFKVNPINEATWVAVWFEPFKNAYEGFWDLVGEYFESLNNVDGAILSKFAAQFYRELNKDGDVLELVLSFKQKYPDYIIFDEILADLYEDRKLWRNAIRYYEFIMDKSVFLYQDYIYFSLAWCYAKIRDYKSEEYYYRKCAEITPTYGGVQNNIAYSLMRQKRYLEAEDILKVVVEQNLDLPESANNLVETYIKQGRYKYAYELIESGEYEIFKYIKKMIKGQPRENISLFVENVADECELENNEESAYKRKKVLKANTNMEQFATEKILEDELTCRLEKGKPVFGMNLRIYDHPGDFYGRQYICNNGKMRLDLLCEDENDNFVIIELKKDSGYDDAFAQLSEYIKWFDENKVKDNQKTYGIICLNNPGEDLIQQVKANDRIKLFEYKISYTEIS